MLLFCIVSVLIIVGSFFGLITLTKRTEPGGCIVFFGLLFLSCLAGIVFPQLFF